MDSFGEILGLINVNYIHGIFISVFIVLLAQRVFKKIDIKNAIRIIKWTLITYGLVVLLYSMILFFYSNDSNSKFEFLARVNGSYKYAYWLILILHSIFPLLLFFRKIGNKVYFVLLVAVLMNIGWLFESFVIHLTSAHRDYLPAVNDYNSYLPYPGEFIQIIQGCCVGIIILIIGNAYKRFVRY